MNESIEIPEEHVSRKAKLSLTIGGFANGLLSGLPFGNLSFYYNKNLGLDGNLVGWAWLIFAIWNVFNDPIFSYIIDNTRTKIGRRIPYIRYGAVFYGLAFIFCWFPIAPYGFKPGDPISIQIPLFLNLVLVLFLLDTAFTIIGCCFFSLPNEIAVTAKQRASLTLYGSVFMFLNLLIGIGLPIVLLTNQTTGTSPFFLPIMVLIGIMSVIILFVASYGIKENLFAQEQPHEGFFEGIKETLKNKPFWTIMIPAFCISLLVPLIQTGILYYIEYVVKDQPIIWFLLSFVLMIVVGLGINMKLLEKWHVKKTSVFLFTIITLTFFLMFAVGYNAYAAILPLGIFGFSLGGALICNGVLMGDCIDNDELITGKRREAIYGGVNALVTKPGISIANWAFFAIIKAFGFIEGQKVGDVVIPYHPQPFSALVGILFAICILPSIGTAVCAIAMRKYSLDGPEWLKKKKYILELHEKKEREYLAKLSAERKE